MMVTTAGLAFSATSANAVLNCFTTEFCAFDRAKSKITKEISPQEARNICEKEIREKLD